MPTWLICIPIVIQWLFLALRYGSATLPSACNPHITAGGLVGEGKLEYLDCMGASARTYLAISLGWVNKGANKIQECQVEMEKVGLVFPVVAKPDEGLCGHGVRRINDARELLAYLALFPLGETVLLQEYLFAPSEAGVFYARVPGTPHGAIIGIALRDFPRVIGNGVNTIEQLVLADFRLRRLGRSVHHQSQYDPEKIPAVGETVRLATIGSTRVGGRYRNGAHLVTPALVAVIDAIARDMPDFYAGRFDLRFDNEADLALGHSFRIMEINGAGSEAIEAWDPSTSLWSAFRTIFAKQALLFHIGAHNRRLGHRPVGLIHLIRLQLRQRNLIARYPSSN